MSDDRKLRVILSPCLFVCFPISTASLPPSSHPFHQQLHLICYGAECKTSEWYPWVPKALVSSLSAFSRIYNGEPQEPRCKMRLCIIYFILHNSSSAEGGRLLSKDLDELNPHVSNGLMCLKAISWDTNSLTVNLRTRVDHAAWSDGWERSQFKEKWHCEIKKKYISQSIFQVFQVSLPWLNRYLVCFYLFK